MHHARTSAFDEMEVAREIFRLCPPGCCGCSRCSNETLFGSPSAFFARAFFFDSSIDRIGKSRREEPRAINDLSGELFSVRVLRLPSRLPNERREDANSDIRLWGK